MKSGFAVFGPPLRPPHEAAFKSEQTIMSDKRI